VSTPPAPDWFDAEDPTGRGPGLRFRCTCCGNCCTGPEGYVLYTPAEAAAIATRLNISLDDFVRDFTKQTFLGPSLREKPSTHGLDCVFLDREKIPGKAVCGIYEDRPAQCRTWPFWKSVIKTSQSWAVASRHCPGINTGPLTPPQQIRILRDTVDM
jgi:Fe-S-cluster containining protein